MFPKTPVAAASRKQASFRDENALLPGKSVDQPAPRPKNNKFTTPTQKRVPLGGKDVNKGLGAQKPLSQPLNSQGMTQQNRSMRASARKRLQVRNDNAAPLAETKHVGLPQHLWASTEIESMPPKEDPVPDVFEEWTFDDDNLLGEQDVLAPAQSKRNSLDLDWDALDAFELPETPSGATRTPKKSTSTPKRELFKPTQFTRPVEKPKPLSAKPSQPAFPSIPPKPIAKPFSRRPARAMVPSAALKNRTDNKENAKPNTPVRSSTPSRIPVRTQTPNRSISTPVRGTHSFMNPTKSAEAKMRSKPVVADVKASPRANRSQNVSRMSRMASVEVLREDKKDKEEKEETRPTTADSNWSNLTDIDRFSFEEEW
ncbi:hypothetical protein CJU89_6328 [Yarrowia sp. B02]|nr:hypothetical protein CJU89_6328 [Yarrowia sp. B02]